MAKIGVRVKINVSKIDKLLLYKGDKGTYLNMTVFIDPDNEGQYGDKGMVTQDVPEGSPKGAILGNVKVFWHEASENSTRPAANADLPYGSEEDDGSIPF